MGPCCCCHSHSSVDFIGRAHRAISPPALVGPASQCCQAVATSRRTVVTEVQAALGRHCCLRVRSTAVMAGQAAPSMATPEPQQPRPGGKILASHRVSDPSPSPEAAEPLNGESAAAEAAAPISSAALLANGSHDAAGAPSLLNGTAASNGRAAAASEAASLPRLAASTAAQQQASPAAAPAPSSKANSIPPTGAELAAASRSEPNSNAQPPAPGIALRAEGAPASALVSSAPGSAPARLAANATISRGSSDTEHSPSGSMGSDLCIRQVGISSTAAPAERAEPAATPDQDRAQQRADTATSSQQQLPASSAAAASGAAPGLQAGSPEDSRRHSGSGSQEAASPAAVDLADAQRVADVARQFAGGGAASRQPGQHAPQQAEPLPADCSSSVAATDGRNSATPCGLADSRAGDSSAAAEDGSSARRATSGCLQDESELIDGDRPQGLMTETQVFHLMSQHSGVLLPLDRFGFIRRSSDDVEAAVPPPLQHGTIKRLTAPAVNSVARLSQTLRRERHARSATSPPASGGLPPAGPSAPQQQQQAQPPQPPLQPPLWSAALDPDTKRHRDRDIRRLHKWRRMLGSGGKRWAEYARRHPAKVQRRVRKGVPDQLRGLVWQLLSGGRELMARNSGVYEGLVAAPTGPKDAEIVRDLSRTYPSHVYFQQRQGPGQLSLYNVLKAFSLYDRKVGYVQGMGFMAGLLLLYMGEEAAFWTLAALLHGAGRRPGVAGLFQPGLPLLQLSLYQFERLVLDQLPALGAHLAAEDVSPTMYCPHWFITAFAYALPFDHLLRVWDVFLLEGVKANFRVGLALLKDVEPQLLAADFEQMLGILNAKWFPAFSRSPEVLLKTALGFSVSARLRKYQVDYEAQHARQSDAC